MTTHVGANEASRILGVSKPTLYAYVSRGLLDRRLAADGRSSLYDRGQIERLANRSRARRPGPRPTIDVEIESGVTRLDDDRLEYRGHDVAMLAATRTFEQVAELLWTGALPAAQPTWTIDRPLLDRGRAVCAAGAVDDPIMRLALMATLIAGEPGYADASAADVARQLLVSAPTLLGGPARGTIAARLAGAHQRRSSPELTTAISRILVLLADHELATSTLGVRIACSVRAHPAAAIAGGLMVVSGPLHGRASSAVVELLLDAERRGAATAVATALTDHRRLPGFGHAVYRAGDPRLTPVLDAVRSLPGAGTGRMAIVEAVLAEAGRRIGALPNIDFGLGSLLFTAALPVDAALFAVARIAGWAAHYDEELHERPLRFRGSATLRRHQ